MIIEIENDKNDKDRMEERRGEWTILRLIFFQSCLEG